MTGEKIPEDLPRESARPASPNDPNPPAAAPPDMPAAPEPSTALTPEEQMEQFAKELKENDWGHQPC